MKRLGKFVFGAVLGGLLGSLLVLLYAPESGNETREALRYRFDGFVNQIKDAVEERRHQLQQEIEKYKNEA